MMTSKMFKPFLIVTGLILLFSTSSRADNSDAQIIDVSPPFLSIELQEYHPFEKGEHIELSYIADVMEMLIGRYEIIHIQNDVLRLRNMSSVFYPSKDMKVRITKVGVNMRRPADMGSDPSAFDPAEMNLQLMVPPLHDLPAQNSSQQMDSSARP